MGETPPVPVWPGSCESLGLDVWCSLNADMPERIRQQQKQSEKKEKEVVWAEWGKTEVH